MKLTNEQLVSTLRELAEFYEQHPNIPAPLDFTYSFMSVYLPGDEAKAILATIGSFEKSVDEDLFIAKKKIGFLNVEFKTRREAICIPRVVATRTIPEKVIPEHEENIIEWDCPPILETA